ncbi:MAG: 3-phosphoglycerate dehydrogenase [Alphaproteobacteria bacterium]|nr:3-phosphoglycerate dehydrogenase [Alphaproteobacteria bacterium]
MRAKFLDCGAAQYKLWQDAQRQFNLPVDVNLDAFHPSDIPKLLAGYDICIDDHTRFPSEILAQCRGIKHFVYFGTGAASILDLQQAERQGIKVHTIRNYGDTTVAELAVGLMFAAARQVAQQHEVLRQGGWKKLQGIELRGKRLGIVGFGGIGREVARIGAGIGLEVVVWNRTPVKEPGIRTVSLDEMLSSSDIVSLHLALNEDTRLFMNKARLASLKPGAILVNTARGGLVDETALVDALRSGAIGHAALDVFQTEPLPEQHLLRTAPNVTLTAHCGFWTESATINQVHLVLGILKSLLSERAVAQA